jgi:hypothetical protein
MGNPLQELVEHDEDTGCTSRHCIHIISFIVCLQTEPVHETCNSYGTMLLFSIQHRYRISSHLPEVDKYDLEIFSRPHIIHLFM